MLKQGDSGYFEPSLTHNSTCKFPYRLEVGNFGNDRVVKGVWRECSKSVMGGGGGGAAGGVPRVSMSLKQAKR